MRQSFLLLSTMIFYLCATPTLAQFKPGDVFKEYIWIPEIVHGEQGKFIRVGGNMDYQVDPNQVASHHHVDGYLNYGKYIDLKNALRAELIVEKLQSHDDTKGLRVSFNKNEFIPISALTGIPEPQSSYMHHAYPVTPIPLDHLNQGWMNTFKFEVDPEQRWGWSQNIIYGLILRVYYQEEVISFQPKIISISENDVLGENVKLAIDQTNQSIRKVDYIGFYNGINYEGDGIYEQWHYHYHRGKFTGHIGTAEHYPFSLDWNTDWIPDQKSFSVAARIIENSGFTYITEAISGLSFDRPFTVSLNKPYDVPKNWATREAVYQQKIDLIENNDITEARLIWVSWSPCYANGVFVNEQKVFDRSDVCYEYMKHDVAFNPDFLVDGTNIIKTDLEPLHNGQMVHGMEVQWPGIILLTKSEE